MVGRQESNAVTFKVLQDATKPEIKAAVELMFKVEVKGVSVAQHQGQDQALRQARWAAATTFARPT
jgi:large subunit ribosomal protein L23